MKIFKTILSFISICIISWNLMLIANNFSYGFITHMNSFNLTAALKIYQGDHLYYEKNQDNENFGLAPDYPYTPLNAELYGMIFKVFDTIKPSLPATFSIMLSTIILFLILKYAYTRTKDVTILLGLTAIFLSLIPHWYFHISPDIPCAFFTFLSFYLCYKCQIKSNGYTLYSVAIVSAFSFLAFWSKQTALVLMPLIAFHIFMNAKSKKYSLSIAYIFFFLMQFTIGTVYYEIVLKDTVFLSRVFSEAHAPLVWSRVMDEWILDVAKKYGMLFLIILIGITYEFQKNKFSSFLSKSEYIFPIALIGSGLFASLKYGSGYTQFLPGLIVLIFSIIVILQKLVDDKRIEKSIVLSLLILQCILSIQNLHPYFINDEDVKRHNFVMKILAQGNSSIYHSGPYGAAAIYYNALAKGDEVFTPYIVHSAFQNKMFDKTIKDTAENRFIKSSPWDVVIMSIPYEVHSFPLYDHLFNSAQYKLVHTMPEVKNAHNSGYQIRWKTLIFQKIKQ